MRRSQTLTSCRRWASGLSWASRSCRGRAPTRKHTLTQQARNASMQMAEWGLPASRVFIDHDTKFTGAFDAVFEAEGAVVQRLGLVAPNLNAYAERWVQSAKTECLDHS